MPTGGGRGQKRTVCLQPPSTHLLPVRSCPNPTLTPRVQQGREGQAISRGTDCCATQFPLWKQPSWHIPVASSPGSAEEEEEEVVPAQLGSARPAAWATAEWLLPAAGVQTGIGGLRESKAPQNCSLAGTNSLKFWPSVCCGILGHVLQLVW